MFRFLKKFYLLIAIDNITIRCLANVLNLLNDTKYVVTKQSKYKS